MKFGEIPVAEAHGAIAAHAVRAGGLLLRKGHEITSADQAALVAAGVAQVVAARLEPGDVHEDAAAATLAEWIMGTGLRGGKPFTGRVNLLARTAGLLEVDVAAIDALNQLDEAITVATLPAFRFVAEGDMAATVKIIPFAAGGAALQAALSLRNARGAISILPFRPLRVAVVSTLLPGLKPSVVAKTLGVLEGRLSPCGAAIVEDLRVAHDSAVVADALRRASPLADLIVIFGASAITDRRDVIPSALEQAGGRIEHFGMPVDPGNLLLLGQIGGRPVVGAPGCARSPKENGFDWVLHRLLAGAPIGRKEIQAMGVGGLLMEIAGRPQPRTGDEG